MDFHEMVKKMKNSDRPEKVRSFDEIVKDSQISNRYEFEVFYRGLSESQKFNLCRFAVWNMLKNGKKIDEILSFLNKND